MKKILLPLIFALSACSGLINKIDEGQNKQKSPEPKNVALLFSHNISGETHPCGCRNFPLGGLPQVAGLFHKINQHSDILYVDTGDTFFPSSVIPATMKDSLSFAANNLALGLEKMGLKYFVPGDQDFALGIEFLREMANKRSFVFLISNLSDPAVIKHQRFAVHQSGKTKIFLAGLVDPDVFNDANRELFIAPETALPAVLEEIKKAGHEENNPYHRLVVLSHAGFDPDEVLAQKFPKIDWIIGSHSQSFLRYSRDVGEVKIVQTLSKNHYLGNINIDTRAKKQSDTYELHEIRDELEQILQPNPFRPFIDEHKSKMSELQIAEQAAMGQTNSPVKKYPTVASCVSCHKPQVNFWQSTPHALAFKSLMNAKEQNNLQCIKCHSLGLGEETGFSTAKNIVGLKEADLRKYWEKVEFITSEAKSVRKLPANKISKMAKEWMALDKKANVAHNFANVQCLNCHQLADQHPFSAEAPLPKLARFDHIKKQCLSCHTNDQSPEWYEKNRTTVNESVVGQKIKKLSCPPMP